MKTLNAVVKVLLLWLPPPAVYIVATMASRSSPGPRSSCLPPSAPAATRPTRPLRSPPLRKLLVEEPAVEEVPAEEPLPRLS